MEWQGSPEERDRPGNNVGRLPNRMGSVSGPSKDGRSVVPGGMHDAHKLPGTASSNSSPEDVCKGKTRDISTAVPGQHYSSGLYKQLRRDSIGRTTDPNEKPMDVVLGKEYPYNRPGSHGEGESDCRRRKQSHERSVSLDADSIDIPEDRSTIRATGD